MRLPRKLKKGCRTLKFRPRTKWQRKGQLHIAKTFENIARIACNVAVMSRAVESIHPINLPPGGIAGPQQTGGMIPKESNSEMVMNRQQLDSLRNLLMKDESWK